EATIIGDLHGDWGSFHAALSLSQGPAIFLGDLVDRGGHSIEVLAAVFKHMLSNPDDVVYLRGNHETMDVNGRWGFQEELLTKYGKEDGLWLWKRVNGLFEQLPICAILNRSFFLVHGGITHGITSTGQLRRRDKTLSEDVAGLLWNDTQEGLQHFDYVPNQYRKRGNRFSDGAAAQFCDNSGIQTIIRGHEWMREGGRWTDNKRTLTVFSQAGYREDNPGAIALVQGKEIRLKFYRLG
ncbi:MAG: metallophosphoesterase family protein, partial [Candidatus Thermoplasmatota archaeon]|nr:metallophosphoesterase family protein [Candidatus Thermoplasmatota archaeon]